VLRSKFRRSVKSRNYKKLRPLNDHHKHPRHILHFLAPQCCSPLVGPSHCNDEKKYSRAFRLCRHTLQSVFIRALAVKTDKSLTFIAHQIVAMTPRWPSASRTGYRTTARTRPSGACGQDQRRNHESYNPAIHFWASLGIFPVRYIIYSSGQNI